MLNKLNDAGSEGGILYSNIVNLLREHVAKGCMVEWLHGCMGQGAWRRAHRVWGCMMLHGCPASRDFPAINIINCCGAGCPVNENSKLIRDST